MTTGPDHAAKPLDDAVRIHAGEVIGGKYEVIRLLGSGGFGAVFLARHTAIGRDVALKVLRPALAQDAQFAQRFLQEARTANEVRHRNIVEVVDFGEDAGRPFMVMEYLRGEPLSKLLERERVLSPARILRLLEPVMRALSAAHARGIVHRDIKPENIFLARDDEPGDDDATLAEPVPKLLDFGIAKKSAADGARLTHSHATLGTPAYMAPEQLTGARDVTPAADQYAVAAVVYEALAGRMPYAGDSYNAMIIAKATSEPVDLAGVRPDLDAGLCAAVMRGLARRADERYGSIAALREALSPYARIDAAPPESVVRAAARAREVSSVAATEAASGAMMTPRAAVVPARTPAASDASVSTGPSLLRTDAGTSGVPRTSAAPRTRHGNARWIVGGGAVLVALVVAYRTVAPSDRSSDPPRAPVVAPGSTDHPSTPVRATNATLQVSVTPPAARIALDGHAVGVGHADIVLPRDGAHHRLRVDADGFVPREEDLVLAADRDVEWSLEPSTEGAPDASVAQAAPAHHTPSAPHRPPPPHGDALRPSIDHTMDLMHGSH